MTGPGSAAARPLATVLGIQATAGLAKALIYSALFQEVVPALTDGPIAGSVWGVMLVLAALTSIILPAWQAWRLYTGQTRRGVVLGAVWAVALLDLPLGLIALGMWDSMFGLFLIWVPPFYLFVMTQLIATHLILRRPGVFAATHL